MDRNHNLENNMKYYQEIETDATNGADYIMTYRFIDGKWEEKPKRGCKVVDATLQGIKNPAQEQGSALTYARRYSLLMAFGLATEDDDAQSLSRPKEEIKTRTIISAKKAINILFKCKAHLPSFDSYTVGLHKGKTLKEIAEKEKAYANWLYTNGDDTIKKYMNLMLGEKRSDDLSIK